MALQTEASRDEMLMWMLLLLMLLLLLQLMLHMLLMLMRCSCCRCGWQLMLILLLMLLLHIHASVSNLCQPQPPIAQIGQALFPLALLLFFPPFLLFFRFLPFSLRKIQTFLVKAQSLQLRKAVVATQTFYV